MKFSIITPSFRNSEWLRLCIASVADQGVDLEHIVQDAGSDDGTLDWLPSDDRVNTFVERDEGMYDAINRGLRKSGGEILAYLNCDEQYLPGALAAVERFFYDHPGVEVVFADTVAVDPQGRYLVHRKVLPPLLYHTWTCSLSTPTCATFFRRRVVSERKILFDPRWRYCGDSDWVLRMLQQEVPMGVLRRFTSVFTQTGGNLSLHDKAQAELRSFFAGAPLLARRLRWLVRLHHYARRLAGGIYFQRPFSYSLFTAQSQQQRVTFQVDQPSCRWRW